jgi:hypothetical protein
MATFDYAEVLVIAQELVTEFGKAVTLRRLNATPPDPDMPWRGPVDPRAVPAETLAVDAVFVEPSSQQMLGVNTQQLDWLKRAQQLAIVASSADLSVFQELVDTDSSVWRVVGVSTLNPGGTRLLHYVGVAR